MKLKDFKKFIQGWPEKKEINTRGIAEDSIEGHQQIYFNGFNQALDLIGNLEFNPAEMVELDEWKVDQVIDNALHYLGSVGDRLNKTDRGVIRNYFVKAFKAGELSK